MAPGIREDVEDIPEPARTSYRWTASIGFRGSEFIEFARKYFGGAGRNILLVTSAGFDPRSPRLAEDLSIWARPGSLRGLIVREERPTGNEALRSLADANEERLRAALSQTEIETIAVFDPTDLAVVGGRQAANLASRLPREGLTDIVVDLSALSVGVSFPLVRGLLELATSQKVNLHAVVVADAKLDASIQPQPAEAATLVHSFGGGLGLDSTSDAARLWLPQLASGRRELLDRVFEELAPHDICPILPFPAHDPRAGDALIDEFLPLLDDAWQVDTRNIIYAAENDPLDVYRTILALNDAREPVFVGHGGSVCVLSPVGSKVLALGALMAATERDFPVLHVEAVGFTADFNDLSAYPSDRGIYAHVWLTGDPYTTSSRSS